MASVPGARRSYHRGAMIRLILLLGVLAAACGGDDGSGTPGDGDGGAATDGGGDIDYPDAAVVHVIMPMVAHSGFDGTNTYQVPVYTTIEDATFAIVDGAVGDIAPATPSPELEDALGSFAKSWAMITTTGPGTTMLSASAGDDQAEASLIVAAYDAADVAVGSQRYNDPANPNDVDRIACMTCHGGPEGVDHTPLALSYYEDAGILEIATEGTYPEGGEVNGGNHTWNFTAAEADGIVPYLRSLEPRGF